MAYTAASLTSRAFECLNVQVDECTQTLPLRTLSMAINEAYKCEKGVTTLALCVTSNESLAHGLWCGWQVMLDGPR